MMFPHGADGGPSAEKKINGDLMEICRHPELSRMF
jgi:hypothetical protein